MVQSVWSNAYLVLIQPMLVTASSAYLVHPYAPLAQETTPPVNARLVLKDFST